MREVAHPATTTTLRCTVLIPAHDEEAILGATLASLAEQSRAADRVVVIADNCTDDTAGVARAHGAEVVVTAGNTEKKAGALNQELDRLLPELSIDDVVMVMDADSTISPEFLEVALGLLGGVGLAGAQPGDAADERRLPLPSVVCRQGQGLVGRPGDRSRTGLA